MSNAQLLEVKDLTTVFPTRRGLVPAVSGVSFSVNRGEVLGVVGESGCGKSVTMLSILRLISSPGRIASGQVLFQGRNLLSLSGSEMRQVRGRDIAMVFQDPQTTMNPAFTVGEQIGESLRIHHIMDGDGGIWPLGRSSARAEKERVCELLAEVGISSPSDRFHEYPHQFSGGMQQRALIAIALACQPQLVLADEPTTSLDVTIQAQIIDLLRRINRERGVAIILVTHNLDLASEFCGRIAVMYAGRIVETGTVDDIIESPRHPYTQGLLSCIPRISSRRARIEPIPGNVPDLAALGPGCAFAPRCPLARPDCESGPVPLFTVGPGHVSRCLLHGGERQDGWSWADTLSGEMV